MKKLKKLSISALSLGATLLIGTNVYAASSTAIFSSRDSDATGANVWVGDNIIDEVDSLNSSKINFYAKVMRVNVGPDSEAYKRTISDYQEVTDTKIYVANDDDYYPRAQWTGEAGLNYANGSVTVISK